MKMWKFILTKLGGVKTRKVVLGSFIGGSSLAYLGPKLYSYGPQPLQATEEKQVRMMKFTLNINKLHFRQEIM